MQNVSKAEECFLQSCGNCLKAMGKGKDRVIDRCEPISQLLSLLNTNTKEKHPCNSFRRMMAAVLTSLSFQLLPLPALADGGRTGAGSLSHKQTSPRLGLTSSVRGHGRRALGQVVVTHGGRRHRQPKA